MLTLSPKAIFFLPIYSRSCPKVTLRTLLSLSRSQWWLGSCPAGETESIPPSFPGMWATGSLQPQLPHLPSNGFSAGNWFQSPQLTQMFIFHEHTGGERGRHLCALPYLESTALSPCSSVSMMGSPEFFSPLGPEMYNVIFDGGYDLDVLVFFFPFSVLSSCWYTEHVYLVAFVWRRRKTLKVHTHLPRYFDECVSRPIY